ncbi:MAG: hypothetical protein AUK54_02390 [Helicobacteraceae bacterium CG2_30_36_10]|nr:MAG: hypothetical protein AUK54_02390 [Helicobacteraceae bacterium CG2_30_36_10]
MKPSPKNTNSPHTNRRKSPPKKSSMDIAPKNEVKEMFMAWFKKHNHVGQVMTKQDVTQNILTKLNAKQNDALEEAMNELKSEQLIELKEDGVTIILTQKGTQCV